MVEAGSSDFKCEALSRGSSQIWWYKHSHRGLCWEYNYGKNVLPQAIYLADMLDDCIESFRKECEKHEDAI